MPTQVTVRGSYSAFLPPERATVHATVGLEGPTLAPVYDGVVRALAAVSDSVAELHRPEAGPITWWSTTRIATWSRRPWNKDGKQLPLVHHASVGVKVKFSDFEALADWLRGHVGQTSGFHVERIEWALTELRKQGLTREVRARAVEDARSRAQEYADALDLGAVTPTEIADAGMLSGRVSPESSATAAYARKGGPGGGGDADLALVPEDIEISAYVDARFVVGER